MDLYTNEDSQELLQSLDRALPYIEYALKNNKPMFEGERYLTSEEICSILKISRRTLQYYRDDGIFLLFNFRAKCCFVNRILGKFWKIGSVQLIIVKIIPFSF